MGESRPEETQYGGTQDENGHATIGTAPVRDRIHADEIMIETTSSKRAARGMNEPSIDPPGPLAAFLDRIYAMVDEEQSSDVVGWGEGGDTFIIKRLELFEKNIIPCFFNHKNLFSFVRQLNHHGFHKVRQGVSQNNPTTGSVQASDTGRPAPNIWWEFKRSNFRRDRRDSLPSTKRRKDKSASSSNTRQQAISSDDNVASMRKDLENLKGSIHTIESKLDELKTLVLRLSCREIPSEHHGASPPKSPPLGTPLGASGGFAVEGATEPVAMSEANRDVSSMEQQRHLATSQPYMWHHPMFPNQVSFWPAPFCIPHQNAVHIGADQMLRSTGAPEDICGRHHPHEPQYFFNVFGHPHEAASTSTDGIKRKASDALQRDPEVVHPRGTASSKIYGRVQSPDCGTAKAIDQPNQAASVG